MPRAYIPPMKRVPEGATEQEREMMYKEYRELLVKMNPSYFNADGSLKTIWQQIKSLFT